MTDRFDHEMYELLQRLKHQGDGKVPPFEAVLYRPQRAPEPLLNRRVQVVLMGCLLLMGIVIFRYADSFRMDGDRMVADDTTAVEETDDLDIDFERLHAAIDMHFDTISRLEWSTPTDSLLAMNFNQFAPELNHE